jgi:hypothetical protein
MEVQVLEPDSLASKIPVLLPDMDPERPALLPGEDESTGFRLDVLVEMPLQLDRQWRRECDDATAGVGLGRRE